MITVYTMPSCMQCIMTTRWLDRHGAPYRTIDLTADPAAANYVTTLGYMSAPVVTVDLPDGQDHWFGYRPDRLEAAAYIAKGA